MANLSPNFGASANVWLRTRRTVFGHQQEFIFSDRKSVDFVRSPSRQTGNEQQ
jgi:hypothetical protein